MSDFSNRPQIEVLPTADGVRRRHWSDDEKLRIVEESFAGHRQVSATARRHGICRSLLTTWRRQYRAGELGGSRRVSFAPVTVTQDLAPSPPRPSEPVTSACEAKVEIALINGRRIIVPTRMAMDALSRLIQVVEQA